jgi:hypothetical protein
MHFHLPKPLHGWRDFAGEVGIIVVGVLIALAGEQAVESLHWHSVVAQTRQALDRELADNLGVMQSRIDEGPCISRRLAELTTIFRRHANGQPLALKSSLGQPQFPHIETSVWETVVADGATAHMPLDVRLRYSRFYAEISWFRDKTDEESEAWSHLSQFDDHDVMTEQDWSALHQWKARAQSVAAKVDANVSSTTLRETASDLAVKPQPFQFKSASLAARDSLCRPML